MKILDISWPISSGITGYKNKGVAEAEFLKTFEKDNVRESMIRLKSHTGTHVDAPSHFMQDGATIDKTDLHSLVGSARVIDMTNIVDCITKEDLVAVADQIVPGDIVLFKTANSDNYPLDPFDTDFVYLEASGAQYLAGKKVKAVGIDYLGIEHSQPDHPTHIVLMRQEIPIIEGLRLGLVTPGEYFFCCLPLLTVGLEAAPARAILIQGM